MLEAAAAGVIRLFSSRPLLEELEGVLQREKFSKKLAEVGLDARTMVQGFREGTSIVVPVALGPIVAEDPDDDAILACAVAAGAEAIVSGDPHLIALRDYQEIPILTPSELLERMESFAETSPHFAEKSRSDGLRAKPAVSWK